MRLKTRQRRQGRARIARVSDHVEGDLGAAARGFADRSGVGRDIAGQRDGFYARTRDPCEGCERVAVASGRDHASGPHRDAEENGGGSEGARRAINEKRLSGREPAAQKAAEGDDEAGDCGELRRIPILEPVERGDRLGRRQRIFGQGSVRPVGENGPGVGARGQADEDLGGIIHVLPRDKMRRKDDSASRADMPDVLPDGLDGSDRVGPDREGARRRIVARQFPLDIGLEIGEQRSRLDPHQNAAGTRRGFGTSSSDRRPPSFSRRQAFMRKLLGLASTIAKTDAADTAPFRLNLNDTAPALCRLARSLAG